MFSFRHVFVKFATICAFMTCDILETFLLDDLIFFVSDYAHRGPDNIGVIFLNQVILGITKDTTNDRNRYFSSLIQNKPQNPTKTVGSPAGHSGGNMVSRPGYSGSVFVVPDDDMALPTYLIFFKFRN